MDAKTPAPDLNAVAAEVVGTIGTGGSIAPFTSRAAGLTLPDAYRVLRPIRAAFEARGEKIVGRKIGFTNRSIWPQYGVYAPIWGYVTDRTTQNLGSSSFRGASKASEPGIQWTRSKELDSGSAPAARPGMTEEVSALPLAAFSEPRIEPEIIFGLARAPGRGMDDAAILGCI